MKKEFRVWDKKAKLYVIPAHLMNVHTGQVSDELERFIIEQFTGILDSKGNKIFEGDIVRFNVNKAGFHINEKEYKNEKGIVSFGKKTIDYGSWTALYCNNETIIGNIHENPELL
jgi:uncharacterized phage protein (TIGR01671 family)